MGGQGGGWRVEFRLEATILDTEGSTWRWSGPARARTRPAPPASRAAPCAAPTRPCPRCGARRRRPAHLRRGVWLAHSAQRAVCARCRDAPIARRALARHTRARPSAHQHVTVASVSSAIHAIAIGCVTSDIASTPGWSVGPTSGSVRTAPREAKERRARASVSTTHARTPPPSSGPPQPSRVAPFGQSGRGAAHTVRVWRRKQLTGAGDAIGPHLLVLGELVHLEHEAHDEQVKEQLRDHHRGHGE
eukprot:4457052-Prymnesium_polylepis.3